MKAVFVDTSFLVAWTNPADQSHNAAVAASRHMHAALITTDYVLVEFGNFVRWPARRHLLARTLNAIRNAEYFDILPASQEDLSAGIALFQTRQDKSWSLTDCISFVVMERMGISEALTTDHHFEQAGFRALLRA